jgi:hypothetical protein
MTLRLEKVIKRSPLDVWTIATNWGIAEIWLGLNRMRLLDEKRPVKVGSKLIYAAAGRDHLMTITDFKPQKQLGLQAMQGGVVVDYQYRFFRVEEGTRVELEATLSAEGAFWRMLLPLARWMIRRSDRRQLEALCHLVEITTGGPQSGKASG